MGLKTSLLLISINIALLTEFQISMYNLKLKKVIETKPQRGVIVIEKNEKQI